MSLQLLDENSFSESKMDISDGTTSVESAGISPEYELKIQSPQSQEPPVSENHNIDACQLEVFGEENNHDESLTSSNNLDNRMILPPVSSKQAMQSNSQLRITIAHPLMSPPGTDSDSEQSRDNGVDAAIGKSHKCQRGQNYNFPDVVPAREHHQKNNKTNPPHNNKIALLRARSLDLLSSESEADVSQYHATVEANLQSVTLISNTTNNMIENKPGARRTRARKNGCDDISSLDSISNHSFDDDEDIEHNLASLSPTSSLADGLDDYDDDDNDDDDDDCDEDDGPDLFADGDINDDDFQGGLDAIALTSNALPSAGQNAAASTTPTSTLPQYTAAEERRNSRNWQKITLPDGRVFEIDMRVIEPYKRVLSHGGYLKAGGHNAIVIFCACHLPDRSRADYNYVMDNLFLYVVKTLEQLVTDDYVLIYMHGGSNRRNVPPFPWLKKCYQLLDRRLRKSLKNMYLVHPTFWVKSIVWMARPFVSVKFWRKLVYVKSLEELSKHVAVEKAAIPEKVKQYDAKHT